MEYHFVYLVVYSKFYELNTTEKGMKRAWMRKLCKKCGTKPVAVNYYKDGKAYYRSKCDHCARGRSDGVPKWYKAGYRKKLNCDKCGYVSNYKEQFEVFYIDGNLNNTKVTNLKTVCSNCQKILHLLNLPWRQGDLSPDF
jgi:hypothetical protein